MSSGNNNPFERFNVDLTPIRNFAQEMDAFFNDSFRQMRSFFNPLPFWIDIQDTHSEFIITAKLPGYSRDQIKIEFFGQRLRIAVKETNIIDEQNDYEDYYSHHHTQRNMERVMTLPDEIDKEETKASFINGLLTLEIPKKDTEKISIDIE